MRGALTSHQTQHGGIDFAVITPVFGEYDLMPVIHGDGRPQVGILPRCVGPQPVWGCAVCEQWHPLKVKSCPLAAGPTKQVYMGPIETEEEGTIYFTMRVPAGVAEL